MDKLDKILKGSLAKRGLLKLSEGAEICFYAKDWGKGLFEPISFQRGILKVSCRSSSAAQKMQMEEENLMEFLNEKLGRRLVRRVNIKITSGN